MIRRTFLLVLCGAAFWAGMEAERGLAANRCLDAGGTVTPEGLCRGLR